MATSSAFSVTTYSMPFMAIGPIRAGEPISMLDWRAPVLGSREIARPWSETTTSRPEASTGPKNRARSLRFLIPLLRSVICASRDNGQVYWITDLNQTTDKAAKNAKKKEKKKKDRAIFFGPVLASGRLVVVSDKGRAVSLDAKTGAIESSIDIGGPALIDPIAMNGLLYVVTDKAELVAIR